MVDESNVRLTGGDHRATSNRYGVRAMKPPKLVRPAARPYHPSPPAAEKLKPAAPDPAPVSGRTVGRMAKSMVLALLDRLPFKLDSPYSTGLLRHYVEGSGDPVSLNELPRPWKDLIIRKTRGRFGMHKDVSSYDAGLYDMQNSLGHFDVEISSMGGGKRLYKITDEYKFGFKKGDRQARHGFPLSDLSERSLSAIKAMLPSGKYWNPGGFEERWEVQRVGGKNILFIPQQFLAQQGVPFEVFASFRE
jgi:hypothetical protein